MTGMSCKARTRNLKDLALVGLLAGMGMAAGCGRFPRDAEGTLAQVERGVMRVGVSHDPPYVVLHDGAAPSGPECELIQALAQARKARIEWVHGGHDGLMRQVQHFELDMVIGGHHRDSPWQPEVSWSREYHLQDRDGLARRQLALPPGENAWQLAVDGFLFARSRPELRTIGVL